MMTTSYYTKYDTQYGSEMVISQISCCPPPPDFSFRFLRMNLRFGHTREGVDLEGGLEFSIFYGIPFSKLAFVLSVVHNKI